MVKVKQCNGLKRDLQWEVIDCTDGTTERVKINPRAAKYKLSDWSNRSQLNKHMHAPNREVSLEYIYIHPPKKKKKKKKTEKKEKKKNKKPRRAGR